MGVWKVLVTGGAGFIGSNLVKRLVNNGHKVTVIDSLSRGKASNLEGYMEKITFIQHDLRTPISLEDNYDIVFDLAARIYGVTKLYQDESGFVRDNLLILLNTLEAVKGRVKLYVFFSSSCIYNHPYYVMPYREGDENLIPIHAYDKTKRFGEEIVKIYAKDYGFDYLILRPFNVYGPGEEEEAPHVVTDFLLRALNLLKTGKKEFTVIGPLNYTRSFTYIDDLIDAVFFLIEKGVKNETFNVGTGKETSIGELAKLVFEVTGLPEDTVIKELPEIPGTVKRRVPDVSKINSLGWQAKVSLIEGLKRTWEQIRTKYSEETGEQS